MIKEGPYESKREGDIEISNGKNKVSREKVPKFKSQLTLMLPLGSYLTSLCFSFFIYKMKLLLAPTSLRLL